MPWQAITSKWDKQKISSTEIRRVWTFSRCSGEDSICSPGSAILRRYTMTECFWENLLQKANSQLPKMESLSAHASYRLLVVNTRTPKNTAESVQLFFSHLQNDSSTNEKKVQTIGEITKSLAKSIQISDNEAKLQTLIGQNHDILSSFDLSSAKLEKARSIFKKW